MRKKAEADTSDEPLAEETATSRSSQTWAMLIKRVYEVDPLCCPECGGEMKVVSFIEPRAPERSDGRGGRDRRYLASLWSMAVIITEGTT